MPLPQSGLAWPPKALARITPSLAIWDAWYVGDPEDLTAVYGGNAHLPTNRPSQYRGGLTGAAARLWWGRPNADLTQRRDQLHVPIAADICAASADLLYAEPPAITVDDVVANVKTIDRLAEFIDDGFHTVLASGAEIGAALGGRFHRVTWDREVLDDRPFLTTVHADSAWPEFRWDRLIACTFWYVLETRGQQVLRHLERHELDAAGNGLVLHGLYDGTVDNLGRAIPLADHESTRALAPQVAADGALIDGRTPGLCVEYIPNQRPQRRWRNDPVGKSLGRSDLDGIEPLMDALDETYSSWMRDIRQGKGRIIVAQSMLDAGAAGQGATFNQDQDIYTGVSGVLPNRDGKSLPLEQIQFQIRVEQHAATAQDLTERIVHSAGYSAQTFGEASDGAQMTATEVQSRERRSFMTRDRKIRLERPAIARLAEKMLSIDAAIFGSGVVAQRATVVFQDGVQDSVTTLAQTVLALEQAKAASTRVKVGMLHADWDETQIDEEVDAINEQYSITLADPTTTVPPGAETGDPLAPVDPIAVE